MGESRLDGTIGLVTISGGGVFLEVNVADAGLTNEPFAPPPVPSAATGTMFMLLLALVLTGLLATRRRLVG